MGRSMPGKARPFKHLAHIPTFQDSPITFFTATIHQRRSLLAHDSAHEVLRGIWQRSAEENGWFVGDYLLMPDHVHFFVRPSVQADRMAEWVKMWKSVSARRFIREFGVESPVWQEDYFDRYLRSSESYGEKWLYVERNPVRAGLVQRSEEWPFKGRVHVLADPV